MASIHKKDGSAYWSASFRDASGKPCSKSTKILREPADSNFTQANYDAAMRIAEEFEREARAGLPTGTAATQTHASVPGIPSFKKFTRGWIAGVGGDKDYHGKLAGYFDHIDEFLGTKAELPVCKLHRPDFAGLAPFLSRKGYSATTVTLHLKILRQAFLAAQQQGLVLVAPITLEDYIVNPSPNRPKRLTIPQIEYLANSTGVVDWRTTIIFGFYFAMDLMEAVNQSWNDVDFSAKTVSWANFTRAGEPIKITIPMHPFAESHLIAVKMLAASEFVTPSLHGISDATLRAHFRRSVENSKLPSNFVRSGRNKKYSDLQFSSFKLSFADEMGHAGLFRLSRFLRSLSAQELQTKIAKLPHLKLKPLPLLAAVAG